ncbi:MAG: PIG-L family deacetylase [Bryobacteraceae bacterium]
MTSRKLVLGTLILLAALLPLAGQPRPFSGTPDLLESIERLNQLGSVLMIAAHPDDERTGVLAYFARGRHMRTAYLSVTRGEGGQNLIGPEQGAALGVIRTQELLAARQIDGATQFFTRAIDFGFSKTAAETMQKWGHDRILSDIVWVIRSYRPDVIILVFTGTPFDGHGHHQVSAILGKEAFSAAADPARFPEQLRYVKPWQATRIVHALWSFGPQGGRGPRPAPPEAGRGPEPPRLPPAGQVETGDFNPVLGYSYEELAVLSRSMHHSQGTGAMRRPGASTTEFGLFAGKPAPERLFDGVDTSWSRLPGGAPVTPILAEAVKAFQPEHPEKIIPLLVKARPLIAAIDDPLAREKLAELDEAIADCAGMWIEAQAHEPEAVPGRPLAITTTVLNRSPEPVELAGARMEGMWDQDLPVKPAPLPYNRPVTIEFSRAVPVSQPYSQPYWLRQPPSGDVYTVEDQRLVGQADTPPVERVRVKLLVARAAIEVERPVAYRYANRAEGERTRPLAVVPPVAVNLPQPVAVFPSPAPRTVHVVVEAQVDKSAGELRLDAPAGWKVEPAAHHFEIAARGEASDLAFTVTPPAGETTASLRAVATVGGREVSSGIQLISYPHIPVELLFPPADIKLVRADIRVTAHRIGYIMGAGDDMPDALRQLGLEVTLLSPSDLEQGDLSRFDAIVSGVRAYNVRADLRANQQRLLDYVAGGGTYVVQYNTGDLTLNLGPYPMTVPPGSRYRVTVEEAPVAFPHADSPLLRAPNAITARDFDGWVQERGLYFASEWDKHYQTVLSCADPGEPALEGGELWTRYGKGVYIYTAYDWFRQLPAGVPGAYRLFANLISAK